MPVVTMTAMIITASKTTSAPAIPIVRCSPPPISTPSHPPPCASSEVEAPSVGLPPNKCPSPQAPTSPKPTPQPNLVRSTSRLPQMRPAPRPMRIGGIAKRPIPNRDESPLEMLCPTGPRAPASASSEKSPTTTSTTIQMSRSWRFQADGESVGAERFVERAGAFLAGFFLCRACATTI